MRPAAGDGRDGGERGICLRPTASSIADQKQQRHTQGGHLLTDTDNRSPSWPRGRPVGKIKGFILLIQLSKSCLASHKTNGTSCNQELCKGYQMGISLQNLSAVLAGAGRSFVFLA